MEPIILASSSPRRQEILKLLNIPFKVIIPNIDETISSAIEPEEIPEFLAREKVTAVIHSLPPQQEILWILGADTIILKEGKIFGKPDSRAQAEAFLREFSGKTHQVITSVVLYNGRKKTFVSKNAVTKVTFSELSDKEKGIVASTFHVIIDIERIGDHATNIAEWVLYSLDNRVK